MPDGSDPGRIQRYKKREKERVKRQVMEPNRTDILRTLRKGERGELPSLRPNQMHKDAWADRTVKNNALKLRILAGEVQGLEEAEYKGTEWEAEEGRDEHPDRLIDFEPDDMNDFLELLAIEKEWSTMVERDYRLCIRNLYAGNDKVEKAGEIRYPQTDHSEAAVDIDTVLTREDLFKLMDEEHPRDKALLAVLWETGSRVTAVCSLKIKNWKPRGEQYGIVQIPGNVLGLKGADYSAKPATFARGYLDGWLAEHPAPDDDEAALFCGIRSQDDPRNHLHPHSVRQQLKRIARRTEGIDPEHVKPHALKHGRASEMRASDKYSKDDIEQILDWEDGTPMHQRYEHVTEEDEAERILRKHGYQPEGESDTVEQRECTRCGTVVSMEAEYCPQCSLRMDDTRPDWWTYYREITPEDDHVRDLYEGDLPPSNVAQLPPAYYDHVHTVFVLATFPDPRGERTSEVDFDVSELDEDGKEWVIDNLVKMHHEQREEHPVRVDKTLDDRGDATGIVDFERDYDLPEVDHDKIEAWRREYLGE